MNIYALESLIRLLTPEDCYICKKDSDMLCLECYQKITDELDSRCYKCNKLSKQSSVCISCRSSSNLRRVWWLANYSNVYKKLIREMKFNRKRSYARVFGSLLASTLPYLAEDIVVVPVPTASARIRRRGFDQAKLIAQEFSQIRNLKMISAIERTSQLDQIGKSRLERKKQMQTAFIISSSKARLITGKSILLIDDVITTGATIEAAASLLRKNGAKHIDASVISRHLLG